MSTKAAFFDRDGTINVDTGYLYKPNDLVFIEGVPELIRKCNINNYLVIVVTNQAGIARHCYTEDDMHALHIYMNQQLKIWNAHIDAFYFCPHHPTEGIGAYKKICNCRKPAPGMILNAIKDFNIDPSQSFLIGDKPWDLEAAKKCDIDAYYINDALENPNKLF